MNPIENFLRNIGLNQKEASIYIALLELGPQAASVIARRVKLPRSSTFFQLDHLVEKGFVKKDIRSNVQYFSAIPATDLKNVLQRQQQQITDQMEVLSRLLPEFNNLRSAFLPESKVSYFEGVEGICKMIDLQIETDEPIYFISAHALHPKIQDYIYRCYIPGRIKKPQSQMIITDFEGAKDYLKQAKDLYDWVYLLRSKKVHFYSTIAIYGNKIQFLSTRPEDLVGILIENDYLAKTMQSMFDLMKEALKKE